MPRKKVIVKVKPEDEEELEKIKKGKSDRRAVKARKAADKEARKSKEEEKKTAKGKKATKKSVAEEEKEVIKETTAEEIDAVSLDEVAEGLEAFEEEETTELEREMVASEKEFDEEIQEERIYIVPLARESHKAPYWKRTKRAIKALREFVTRHMKPEELYIDPEVNERLWENGIKNPPRKIRIRVTKSTEGFVRVFLA
ncbi:MAG: 50S ribosomal protein L31e [Promethearchaeota archaeon]